MPIEITMPKLGESVTEGTISKWLVKPGDLVQKYDPIAEVMTDKVNAEIPSTFTGTINEILVKEEQAVEVGVVICTMDVHGDAAESVRETPVEKKLEAQMNKNTNDESQKQRYSPAVLRMSQDHGIDLEQVTGSGKGGRITRKDLQQFIDQGGEQSLREMKTDTIQSERSVKRPTVEAGTGDVIQPLSGIRKVIAENMVNSKREVPHAWTMIEVDVTNLVSYRNKVKEAFKEKEGYSLTYLPFFIKAIVESLKEFPQMNSVWSGDKVIQKKNTNISVAVATDEALYVPVIQHADEKSVKGIAREMNELVQKVRTGTLSSADMDGGTFTVNNTGSFGSILSTPIINQPQAAILSIESIVKRAVVLEKEEGDMIAIRSMVNLCLSLDHRILDGLVCGRFLARVKETLEQMSIETTSIY